MSNKPKNDSGGMIGLFLLCVIATIIFFSINFTGGTKKKNIGETQTIPPDTTCQVAS